MGGREGYFSLGVMSRRRFGVRVDQRVGPAQGVVVVVAALLRKW